MNAELMGLLHNFLWMWFSTNCFLFSINCAALIIALNLGRRGK